MPGREYQIDIGQNILDTQLPKAVKRNSTAHVVVVTNTTLQELYPNFVFNLLADSGVKISTCVLPDGEKYKNLDTLSMVFDFLMDVCANRKSLLIAFGGGNFLVLSKNRKSCLEACEIAVNSIKDLPNVITPFPGGVVRSGSKVGSK